MRILLVSFLLLLSLPLSAQLYTKFGLQLSSMSRRGPIESKGPFWGWQFGIGGEDEFFSGSKLRLGVSPQYSYQGYSQQKGGKDFYIHMHYLQLPVYVAYPLTPGIKAEAGAYIGGLVRARLVHEENNYPVAANYKNTDFGLLTGLVFFNQKRLNLFVRYRHGLIPQLTYPIFTASGEETGVYRLLKPWAVTSGIRFNLIRTE